MGIVGGAGSLPVTGTWIGCSDEVADSAGVRILRAGLCVESSIAGHHEYIALIVAGRSLRALPDASAETLLSGRDRRGLLKCVHVYGYHPSVRIAWSLASRNADEERLVGATQGR